MSGRLTELDRKAAENCAASIRMYWARQGVTVQTWIEWIEGMNKSKRGHWAIKSEGIPTGGSRG